MLKSELFVRPRSRPMAAITRASEPNLQTDASAFGSRAIGAVLMVAGLPTSEVGNSVAHHSAAPFF